MRVKLAWRNVSHDRGRAAVGVAGVAFAIMLIFLQLGFYNSVVISANQYYDELDYDLVLVSREYNFLRAPQTFPRRRLHQAMSLSEVQSAEPLYISSVSWQNTLDGRRNAALIFAFDVDKPVFRTPSIRTHLAALKRPDTAIADSETRPKYGNRKPGSTVEISGRNITIVDDYRLGTSFLEMGILVTSDQNFRRLHPAGNLNAVTIGLIKLKPGTNAEAIARTLDARLPDDVHVWSREYFRNHEIRHWVLATSTGFIFGSGVVVAVLVGLVILYQTVSTQIMVKMNEYATLKAIGYQSHQILRIVLEQACLISLLGFLPGLLAGMGLYAAVQAGVFLPMVMTWQRIVAVLIMAIGMSVGSGWLAFRKVQFADPADLF
jgi:putative ABC transport system permease protein